MIKEFYYDWFSRLVEKGELPTMDEVDNTVSIHAAWDAFDMADCLRRTKMRRVYIGQFSFPLMTKEVAKDMADFIKSGSTVLEVCCGSGFISKCIKNINPEINFICTDNMSWHTGKNHGYGSSMWDSHFMDIIEMDALEAIEKYGNQADYVLLSWPEYNSPLGLNILEKCIEKNLKMIYIGEWETGCTADDDFFTLIDAECDVDRITDNYIPFEGIHDNIYIITSKSNKNE